MADRILTDKQTHGLTERRQEVAPGEFAPEVYTVTAGSAAIAKQKLFVASSGPLVLSAAGSVRATLANPAGSGLNIHVEKLEMFSNAGGEPHLFVNPSAGLPATAARPHLNAVIGAGAGVAIVKADTDTLTALSGGTDTGVTAAYQANVRAPLALPPLVIAPGVTLGLNIAVSAASSRSFLTACWFEEAI